MSLLFAGRSAFVAVALAALIALPGFASVSVRRSPDNAKTVDVYISNEPLTTAIGALEMYLPKRVDFDLGDDPVVSYRAKDVAPEKALRALAEAAKVELASGDEQYTVRSPGQPTVSLDVKDAEVREILKSMQRQCGIRNLLIDPQVQGTGTFLFNKVPCRQAFDVVLRSLGIGLQEYSDTIVSVGPVSH